MEQKFLGGSVLEVKTEERNGVQVGIVEGYIATWDIDRGDWMGIKDQFVKGAFLESLMEHVMKKRQIRLKDHHGRTIGGFPMEFVKEDERGLFGVGEINLEVQQGREAYALAKQGVLVDFSIGFSVVDFEMDADLRSITKAIIWEGSIVDEPMNDKANITQVKKHEDDNVKTYNTADVKDWGKRELEQALREGAKFSKNASKAIISLNIWTDKDSEEDDAEATAKKEAESKQFDEILNELKGISAMVGANSQS
jgi:HK97 family phage prohead protease